MTEPVFVDTNIWVYAVDAADPVKRERALQAIAAVPGRDLVVSTQVLTEFYAVVTRKLAVPVPEDEAGAMVDQLRALPVVAIGLVVEREAHQRVLPVDDLPQVGVVERADDVDAVPVVGGPALPGGRILVAADHVHVEDG